MVGWAVWFLYDYIPHSWLYSSLLGETNLALKEWDLNSYVLTFNIFLGATQGSQNSFQRLVKRMTRFWVNTDKETTEKELRKRWKKDNLNVFVHDKKYWSEAVQTLMPSYLSLSISTLWRLWPCSKASKVYFESIKNNIWKHQKQQAIKFDAVLTEWVKN